MRDVVARSDGDKRHRMARRWRARPQTWWWIAVVVALPVLALTAVSLVLLLVTTHPATAGDQINLVRTALAPGPVAWL